MSPRVIDLFAGCGGLSLGLEMAGIAPIAVAEINDFALQTYLQNRSGLPVQQKRNQIRDILGLTQDPNALESFSSRIRREFGEVDLVVGGPPCQGYSGIGHRRTFRLDKHQIPSNHLYREYATFIRSIAPKAFVFENVRGLLSARWSSDGQKGEIWRDVSQALSTIDVNVHGRQCHYEFRSKVLYAKDYGVPQNRPRVIGIGIRSDIADQLGDAEWHPSSSAAPPNPIDLLDDLSVDDWQLGPTLHYPSDPLTAAQERMRTEPSGRVRKKGEPVTEQEYSNHSPRVIERFSIIRTGGTLPESLRTKKFAQRPIPARWDERGPMLTVASMPDDYVHYAQDRAPTVREWARLQTFPDWYKFSGPRTTGGRRRAGDPQANDWSREVPKFTQIGNAVPVLMGEAIGAHLVELLDLS